MVSADPDAPIYVNHAAIETATTNLNSHKATFDEVLTQLEGDLAPMIGTWSGEARELYLAKKKAWDAAALDLSRLLAHIVKITGEAHAGYVNAVSSLINTWAD